MSARLALRRRIGGWLTPVFQAYWRISRGMTLGVRALVEDSQGRICLVRHSYIDGWHLPGGGVERGETIYQALQHELAEEAGVAISAPPALKALLRHTAFRGDHIALFHVTHWTACTPANDGEITDIVWVSPDTLPEGTTLATARRIAEHATGGAVSRDW